jgi:hypothetical protein
MQGATRVNDEFEVGFNEEFENRWYYAELAGRAMMLLFGASALIGLLGRGPLSHRRAYAPAGGLSADYEFVVRHGTPTTVTLHVTNETAEPRPVMISIGQSMIEPMGLTQSIPVAESSTVSRDGLSLRFVVQPNQPDALIRLDLQPNALGPVSLQADDGDSRVTWSVFVAP